jgi:hypothetical protein
VLRCLRDRAPTADEKDDRWRRLCVKDGGKKRLRDQQDALSELGNAVRLFRRQADSTPLTLREADYAAAVERLNAAIYRADGLVSR